MQEKPTRIIVKGLKWSGSGAVTCLLQEFKNIFQVPGGAEEFAPTGYRKLGEFNYFRIPGGVGDQLKEGHFNGSIMPSVLHSTAKKGLRYDLIKTIKNFGQIRSWKQARNNFDTYRNVQFIHNETSKLNKDFKSNTEINKRIELTEKWLNNIITKISPPNTKGLIFDQAIYYGPHDDIWPIVFDPFRLIIVHRDPRDQIAEQFKYGRITANMKGDVKYIYGWDFEAALRFRIDEVKARMVAIDKLLSDNKIRNHVLLIRFESLILNYDETVEKIQHFLGLKASDHNHKGEYLNTEWSKKNIGIHKNIEVPHLNDSMMLELMNWYISHP